MSCAKRSCKTGAKKSTSKGKKEIKGAIVAIVTPFKDGEIDEKAYRELIDWHIKSGTHAIVPVGTTGESATLSHDEHKRVIEICIDQVKGRVPVIAGAGSNNTEESLDLARFAKKAGADAILMVTPYYNKPTQEGLYQHYKTVAEEVKIPIILYNVPGRTSVNLLPSTVARLSKLKYIVGIKEASGNLKQVSEVIKLCGPKFIVLSGDDPTSFATMALGGRGVISVTSNVMPKEMARMMDACLAGEWEKAKKLHYKLFDMFNALFIETNPVPAKQALYLMGKIESPEVRLPLASMQEENVEKLKAVLAQYKLI